MDPLPDAPSAFGDALPMPEFPAVASPSRGGWEHFGVSGGVAQPIPGGGESSMDGVVPILERIERMMREIVR
jgi:hypothetical protein